MNTTVACNVLIADDEVPCQEAITLALSDRQGIAVCGVAGGGEEMVQLASALQPDVIITDIRMPGMNGIEAARIVKQVYPQVKVLALTQHRQEELIVDMTCAGADGYLLKDAPGTVLETAIHTVMKGEVFFCKSTMAILQQMLLKGLLNPPFSPLPPGYFATNEKEVLLLLCQGFSSKQIAGKLGLRYNTVIKYRQNLLYKTGMENEVALAMFAVLHKIYIPGSPKDAGGSGGRPVS